MQVNYDFYENLTALKYLNRIIADLDAGKSAPRQSKLISGALHERHALETPLISRRWGDEGFHKIDVYLMQGGYQALEKSAFKRDDSRERDR